MKKFNIVRYIIPVCAIVMVLSSCLKDDNVQQDLTKLEPIIEIPDASPNSNGSPNDIAAAVVGKAEPIAYSIPINYAFGEKSPGVKVTIKVDEATLAKYNDINKDDQVEMLPSNYFSIPSNTIEIPAGQQTGSFVINLLNTIDDAYQEHNYAIPIKITDASGKTISGNYGSAVVKVKIKNPWDGVYNYKSSSDQSLNPGADEDGAELETLDATHVQTHLVNTYSNIVIYQVDPATNKITVTNSGGIGAATTDPSSHYDPETKVFYVKWKTSNRKFEETYTYIGSRD